MKGKFKFKADHFALCRSAILPADMFDRLAQAGELSLPRVVADTLADPYVREAIWLASPGLLERFDNIVRERPQDAVDEAAVVAKYLLRMAYRSTPFGTFAAVGRLLRGDDLRVGLEGRSSMHRSVQISSSAAALVARCITEQESRDSLKWFKNDTTWISGKRVVWITRKLSRRGKCIYSEESADFDESIGLVLDLTTYGATHESLVGALLATGAEPDAAEAYLAELRDAQLICRDHILDITSSDLSGELFQLAPVGSSLRAELSAVDGGLKRVSGRQALDASTSYLPIVESLRRAVGVGNHLAPNEMLRVDLYGGDVGTVPPWFISKIERVVSKVVKITKKHCRLTIFAQRFTDRFGGMEVPLLEVIPHLGSLGYLEREAAAPSLVRAIGRAAGQPTVAQSVPRPIHTILLDAPHYVEFPEVDESQPEPSPTSSLSLVAWLSLWRRIGASEGSEPLLEIRSVGAQEPGRVMGRFAYEVPGLGSYLSAKPPGRIVAEIVHLPEDDLGGVCARPRLSEVEIGIRSGPSQHVTRLGLADLNISVRDGSVLVRSRSLEAFLDIRMSNAHAYDRVTNLHAYRFLNSVAKQGVTAGLPNLRDEHPDAPFVPGLTYQGVVLARPTWRFTFAEVEALAHTKVDILTAFRRLSETLGMPPRIALIQGDQIIPFDTTVDWMCRELVRHMKRSPAVLLTVPVPGDVEPFLRSPSGAHHHEIQLALRAGGTVVGDEQLSKDGRSQVVKGPDSEWTYIKVYSAISRQNAILSLVGQAAVDLRNRGEVEGFFYVRYRDDRGSHLRLRFQGTASTERVLTRTLSMLHELDSEFDVQDIVIENYVRETERYGGGDILALCEQVWLYESQAFVHKAECMDDSKIEYWKSVAIAIDRGLRSLGFTSFEQRLQFSRQASAGYAEEMKFNPAERKRVGEVFKAAAPAARDCALTFDNTDLPWDLDFADNKARALIPMLLKKDARDRYSIVWSMLHMRFNRLFLQDHRFQEAVIWELMKRSYTKILSLDEAVRKEVQV